MNTHRILGFFLIISLCFSSAYMCEDGQEFAPQAHTQGQQAGDEHEHEDGDEHHEGCGHDHNHG